MKGLADTAKKEGFKAYVSMVLFDSNHLNVLRIDTPRTRVDVENWIPLESSQIRPAGGTPLYDAVDHAITSLTTFPTGDLALVVITDGGENASRKTATFVKERIQAFQGAGHLMIYLGANQDAWAVGGGMGTSHLNTATYTMANMGLAMSTASAATMRYATSRNVSDATFTGAEVAGMAGVGTTSSTKAK